MSDTSMRCSDELLEALHDLKRRGDTYEDVVWRLLDNREAEPPRTEDARREPPMAHEDGETDDERPDLDLPGSGAVRDRREEVIYQMAALLEREGTATKQDFLEIVDPDAVGYASAESFWANCVKGRDSFRSIDGVRSPPVGMAEWEWVG